MDWKDMATIVGALVALATLTKGVIEYVRQGAQKRAELFMQMQKRFVESPTLDSITALLERRDPKLSELSFAEKSTFLRFFEEIAIMVQSGLLKKDVAHYMFGYYAVICWKSEHFWQGVNRDGAYWSLFRRFASDMTEMEKASPFHHERFRF